MLRQGFMRSDPSDECTFCPVEENFYNQDQGGERSVIDHVMGNGLVFKKGKVSIPHCVYRLLWVFASTFLCQCLCLSVYVFVLYLCHRVNNPFLAQSLFCFCLAYYCCCLSVFYLCFFHCIYPTL